MSRDQEAPDSVEKGLAEAFGEVRGAPLSQSVLRALESRTGSSLGVHLESTGPDDAPVKVTEETKQLRDPSGRYQVVGEIGRGAVGVVYKGRDVDLGRDVAMKILKDEYVERPDILARFVEEAQIGGQLQHPGIVPVYELGLQAGERPYFAMKLVKGETLAAQLARRSSPTEDRRRLLGVFEQVCQTIAYAHARRVVHRDLKPANMMIGAFGEVQVVDWGFAKVLPKGELADEAKSAARASQRSVIETVRSAAGSGTQSVAGSLFGTPAYMPPEQALGDIDRLDQRSDVFGLGAILCEILTGAPPYLAENGDLVRQAAAGALEGAYERLRKCGADDALVELCTECLSRARRARPESAAELVERISDYLTSVEERTRQAEVSAAKARYKHRVTVLSATAALIVLVLGAGTWLWLEQVAQTRRADAARRVASAMSDASGAFGKAQAAGLDLALWDSAMESARQLESLAADDDVEEKVREEAESLLSRVQDARAKAQTEVARRERDAAMLERLETLRIPTEDNLSDPAWPRRRRQHLDRGYEEAFTTYLGRPLLELSMGQAITALDVGDIEVELAASLDHWALVRDTRIKYEETEADPAGIARLREIAEQLDQSDPWRSKLRTLLPDAANQKEQLLALAKSADFASLPAAACRTLAIGLGQAGAPEAALTALTLARETHPQDFDLCFQLAILQVFSRPPRRAEAVDTLRIAHALRPKHAEVLHRQGILLSELERYEESERVFHKLVALDPENGHWLRHKGYAVQKQGKFTEALAIYERALRLSPRDSMSHNQMGIVLEALGRRDDARRCYETAVKIQPREADAWTNLGILHWKKGRFEHAVRCHKKALAVNPNYKWYNNNIGVTLMAQGKLAEAIRYLRKAASFDPDNAQILTNLGNALWGHGQLGKALAAFRQAVQADPNHVDATYKVGGLLAKLGRSAEAVKYLHRAAELAPRRAMIQSDLGLALMECDDLAGARRHLEKAVHLDRKCAPAHINLGQLCLREEDLGDALAAFKKAAKFHAADESDFGRRWARIARARVDFVQGQLLMAEGRLPTAVAHLKRALEVEPESPGALGALGAALLRSGKPREAIPHLEKAVQTAKFRDTKVGNYVNLGSAYMMAGQDPRKAERCLREALRLDSKNTGALLNLGQVLLQQGNRREGRELFQQAIDIDPSQAQAHLLLGHVQEADGELEAAVTSLETALRIDPRTVGAYVPLGIAYRKLDRLDDAVTCFQRGVKVVRQLGDRDHEGQLHINAGQVLERRGDLKGAITAYESAEHAFAKLDTPFARRWHRWAGQRREELADRLSRVDEIITRRRAAASSKEWARVVYLALRAKRYREVVKLAETTLRDAPELAGGRGWGLYNAACAAALSSEIETRTEERARLRSLARTWLAQDIERSKDTGSLRHLRRALEDRDFACVRGDALRELPEAERKAWRALWERIQKATKE